MNREEIIEMLASIGVSEYTVRPHSWKGNVDVFRKFADLVAAKEREKAAQMCEFLAAETLKMITGDMSPIHKSVTLSLSNACTGCAYEIRLMGDQQ